MAGRKNQGDQRGRKQHFDNRNVPVIAAEYSGERVRVVDAEAFGGANSKAAMILVERDEVERWSCHGYRQAGGLKLRSLDIGLSRWMI